MMYVDFTAGNKDYKLRLNVRSTVALEKQLGCNPLAIFGKDGSTIPTLTTMVNILHASLQHYHHGISLNDAYAIFDEYLEEHTVMDFIAVIIDVYRESGILPKEVEGIEPKN